MRRNLGLMYDPLLSLSLSLPLPLSQIDLCTCDAESEGCEHGESMAPKKAKAKKKYTGDDKGDEKVCTGEKKTSRELHVRRTRLLPRHFLHVVPTKSRQQSQKRQSLDSRCSRDEESPWWLRYRIHCFGRIVTHVKTTCMRQYVAALRPTRSLQ